MNVNIPAKFGACIKNRIILRLQVAGLMLRTKKNFYTRKPRECDVPSRVALLFSFLTSAYW